MQIGLLAQEAIAKTLRIRDDFPHFLQTGPTPPRFRYFNRILSSTSQSHNTTILDVGCGSGFLAEKFAAAGYSSIRGVDPSADIIEIAREHSDRVGLTIDYSVSPSESLPFADDSFHTVLCCDVLEHSQAPNAVLAEIARVLAPSGLLLYSTINRTLSSKMMAQSIQSWFPTRILDMPLYDWKRFITPEELHVRLISAGLEPRDTVGLKPHSSPLLLLLMLSKLQRGRISHAEFGQRCQLGISKDVSLSYMGCAVKPVPQ